MDESDDPVTIAVIAIGAGAGIQAYGQYQQGKAAEAQAKAEQQILNYNAKIKERQAAAEMERARAEAIRFGKEGEALLATQQVQIARGGVLATTGTPFQLAEETELELEADRMMILREGLLAESCRIPEAEGLRFEGRAARARGKNIRRGATLAAGATILSGIGQAGFATYKTTAFGTGANSFKRV